MKTVQFHLALSDIACAEAFLKTPEEITSQFENNPRLWEEVALYKASEPNAKPAAILTVQLYLNSEAANAGLTDPSDLLAALQFGATDLSFQIQQCIKPGPPN